MASLNLSSTSASASCLSLFLISVISIHLSKYPVDGISEFSPNLISASVGSVATIDIKAQLWDHVKILEA